MKNRLFAFLTLAWLATLNPELSILHAQGTAFTYQGRLTVGTNPANGSYDLKFSVYDTNQPAGTLIAGPITNSASAISNGLFTATMDFGPGVFTGMNYWLDVAVRTNGTGAFTELTPRQPLTPAPYAIFANTSSNLSGTVSAAQLSGTVNDAQLTHSAVTVNAGPGLSGGGRVALGNTITLTNTGVLSVTGSADITASTVGGAVTLDDTATSADTTGTLVKRDGSGNFSAASITLDRNLNLPATTATAGIIYSGGTTLVHAYGIQNFFAGPGAGNLTMSGSQNTANGYQALFYNTSGYNNTANGRTALFANTSGSENTASGDGALESNTNGSYNTANGSAALNYNTSGSQNTAIGANSLIQIVKGGNNTALGFGSLGNLTNGNYNIALGYQAGGAVFNGYNNIEIGNLGNVADYNYIRIGLVQTNTSIAGIFGIAVSGSAVAVNSSGQLGVAPSSQRFKQDIHSMDDASSVLLSLRPVTFKYEPGIDPKGIPQFGLVAEEVDQADPDLVVRDDKGQIFTVRYEAVNAMLLNEFLKEHRDVEAQKAQIQNLKQQNDSLAERLKELETKVKSLAETK